MLWFEDKHIIFISLVFFVVTSFSFCLHKSSLLEAEMEIKHTYNAFHQHLFLHIIKYTANHEST